MAGAAVLATAVNPVRAADNKPNVVHIVADDLGWKDVGFTTNLRNSSRDVSSNRFCLIFIRESPAAGLLNRAPVRIASSKIARKVPMVLLTMLGE